MGRYAREGQKTAKCFRCGYLIPISSHRVRILLKTRRLEVAKETVKRCKEKIGFRGHF
jgi:hypothetical protein